MRITPLLLLLSVFCNCLITSKTARITTLNTNAHTFSAELMSDAPGIGDMAPNIRYTIRRGLTEKFEMGFNAELVMPSVSIGAKYGFSSWCAVDINAGVALGSYLYPVGDLALIFSRTDFYGGLKCEVFGDGGINSGGGTIHPFLGYEFIVNERVRILPEICIGSLSVDLRGVNSGSFVWFVGVGLTY